MTADVMYLTTREVAKILRVDPATVRRWADAGDITAVKLPGGQYRFAETVVDALLAPESPRPASAEMAS